MFLQNGLDNPKVFLSPDEPKGGGDPDISKLVERTEYLEKELKTVISQRDSEKKEKADALGKLKEIEDSKKIEAGEFQKLADEYKTKYESVLPELDKYKKDSDELTTYKENRKKTLLESIPEDKREEWKQSDLTTLEKVVPLFSGSLNIQVDDGKTGKKNGKIETAGKTWKDFSVDQLEEIKKQNPQEYDRLFRANGKVVI